MPLGLLEMSGASTSHPEGRKNLTMLIPVLRGGGSAGMELHVKGGHEEEGDTVFPGSRSRGRVCRTSMRAWPLGALHLNSEINLDEADFYSR